MDRDSPEFSAGGRGAAALDNRSIERHDPSCYPNRRNAVRCPQPGASMVAVEFPTPRVLLVDDERDLIDFLSQRLAKRGFSVRGADSGESALELATQCTFDVAVVDLKMPKMDGITVIKRLKALQPFIETIMLTGHGSHESALEAGRLQAHQYLLKPYDFDDLVEKIKTGVEARRESLREGYLRELEQVRKRSSAREIKAETERLRRRYEQP
jgi:DNA-binding NtrC family response regulator